MAGDMEVKHVAEETTTSIDKVAGVIEGSRYVGDKKDPVIFLENCGVNQEEWSDFYGVVDAEKLKVLSYFPAGEVLFGNVGIIVAGTDQEGVGISCASTGFNRRSEDSLVIDGVVLINMKNVDLIQELEGEGRIEITQRKIRHELAHLALSNYVARQGLDIHDDDLKIFSELVAVWIEEDGDIDRMKSLVDTLDPEELMEISNIFPSVLEDGDMYRFLPAFFAHISEITSGGCTPLRLLDNMVKSRPPRELDLIDEQLDAPEKMLVYWLSEAENIARSPESNGTYGGTREIPVVTKGLLDKYFKGNYNLHLDESWSSWRAGLQI
jgi:hypothetical protein